MKMKDVCKQTGLTDRAVRFYIEKGLLQTHSQLVNGRISRDFTEEDVLVLIDIAKLRSVGFSIQDIIEMQNTENDINQIIEQHCRTLEEKQQEYSNILEELREINKRGRMPWRKLASILSQEKTSKEDIKLHWPQEDIDGTISKKKRIRYQSAIAAILFVTLMISLTFLIWKYFYDKQEHSFITLASDIVFEEKYTEDGVYYTTFHSVDESGFVANEFFTRSRTLPIRSWDTYKTLKIHDEPYNCIQIVFKISRTDAKELDLLSDDGFLDGNRVAEVILTDMELTQKYGYILSIDGGSDLAK